MSNLTTFVCEYKILPEHSTRDTCMTLFGGMTKDDDLRELGNVKLLGRWSCVGEARGYCIAQAKNVVEMQRWLNAWVSMADIKVWPCLDDNQQREVILGHAPSYNVTYDHVSEAPREGESLYFINYRFRDGHRAKGFETFANMTQEMDSADSGRCTSYGRWHVPSEGRGVAVASSPSAFDIYKWAHNWAEVCECHVTPVTRDEDTRSIIRDGMGYQVKHAQLMEQMKSLMPKPCVITARFVFKDEHKKNEFVELLSGEQGLGVTRKWKGCKSVECFESHENPLEFLIHQEWESESDHASYMEMRKQTGLFKKVTTEMLASPLDIVHHSRVNC